MKQNRNNAFLIIGITGGAGSGKTTVVECLKKLADVRFVHCDTIAHELMEPGQPSYEALVGEYGPGILEDGTEPDKEAFDEKKAAVRISRERLAKIAFAAPEKAKRLNEITHPLVRIRVEEELSGLEESGFQGIAVIEAALLIEAGYQGICDELWYVRAPREDRVRRMQENRGYSAEKIEKLLAAQLSEEEFLLHADFVIDNPDLPSVKEQEEHILSVLAPHLKELESAKSL